QDTLQTMHAQQTQWARSGPRFLEQVCTLIDEHQPASILDYGCGKAVLAEHLHKKYPQIPICLYDPGVPEFQTPPPACDMVICTDVLEHIEPELIDRVLDHIVGLTKKVAYFVVHTGDCGHKLPDGRPAHILQRPQEWWEDKLDQAYGCAHIVYEDTGLPMRFQVTVKRL
ncbi:MAG: methyltransferase domain-containing protein, partial [Candidatus Puniceispirillaceae bacterium]